MPTLNNFTILLSATQVKKGKEYFESGAVDEVLEVTNNEWQAEVTGTEVYYVKVKLKEVTICGTSCDCPHDDPFCKHVIAVLFHIQDHKNILTKTAIPSTSATKKKGVKTASFETVLEKINEKALKEFVKSFAARNKEFRNLFLLRYAVAGKENGVEKFRTLIRQTAAAYTRKGFIDWDASRKALQPAVDILEEAVSNFSKQNFRITFEACCALVLEVPLIIEHMDDSNGVAVDCVYGAFNYLKQLSETTEVPYDLKDEIFYFAQQEHSKSVYAGFGFDHSHFELMAAAAYDEEKQETFFSLVCANLKKVNEPYQKISWLDLKLQLLYKLDRKKEAEVVLKNNLDIPQYREQLINQYIEQKDFQRAKYLANEGVQIENKKVSWNKSPDKWEQWLLKIAHLQNDVPAIRNHCKNLYFNKSFNHAYYLQYKKTFKETDWETEREKWILQLKNAGRITYHQVEALAEIYITERFYEALLDLLQKAPGYEFAKHCQPHLEIKYPAELLLVFRQSLIEFAVNNISRNYYVELRKRLKEVQKISGGKEVVKELVTYFLVTYKARKAMVEELGKLIL